MADINQVLDYVVFGQWVLICIVWLCLIITIIRRAIKKLREQYIDWIMISCSISVVLFLSEEAIVYSYYNVCYFWSEIRNKQVLAIFMIIDDLFYVTYYWFILFSTLYSAMLISYSYKLSLLNQGCEFTKVKKKINNVEILSVSIIIMILLAYAILYGTIDILLYHNE